MTEAQLSKLPIWAQREFRIMQRENDGLRQRLDIVSGTVKSPLTWSYDIEDEEHGIPPLARIGYDGAFYLSFHGGYIDVYSNFGTLLVIGQSTNAVRLETRK